MKRMTVLVGLVAVLAVGCAGPELVATETPAPAHTPVPPSLTPTSTPTPLPTPSPTPTPQIREVSLGGEFTEEERALAEAQKNQAREFVYRKAEELGIGASLFTILSVRNKEGVFTYIKSPEMERFQDQRVGVWYAWTPEGIVKPPLTAQEQGRKNAVREWNEKELRIEYVDNWEVRRAYFDPETVEIKDIISLRNLADKKGFKIGVMTDQDQIADKKYSEILVQEYNVIMPGGGMKFGHIHPYKNHYDFHHADTLVDFAERHGMEIRGHNLVWNIRGPGVPSWLIEEEPSRDEAIQILQDHIRTVVGRYKGRIKYWDVVNEGICAKLYAQYNPNQEDWWRKWIGDDYIEIALRTAHEADPNALLFLNEPDWEVGTKVTEELYATVRDLLEKGVPIHGVGMEMHCGSDQCPLHPDPEKVAANVKRFTDLGLQVHITEMDVPTGEIPGSIEEKLRVQAEIYREVLRVCLETPKCTYFGMSAASDRYSWRKNEGAPAIFDENYRPKPAYYALMDLMSKRCGRK